MPDQFLHGVEVIQSNNGTRPIATQKSSTVAYVGTAEDADAAVFPLNENVLINGPRHAAELGAGGTLLDACNAAFSQGINTMVVNRVAEGADAAATLANVVGTPASAEGVYGLLEAQAQTGLKPRIIAIPGFSKPDDPNIPNPVANAMATVADKVKAMGFIEGPNTTEADAITYRDNFGSKRLEMVDPYVRVFDAATGGYVTKPSVAYFAGVRSNVDLEMGYWYSHSNKLINGIAGTARPIDFNLNSPETQANRLNENEISTIIREDGFRTWGNRTLSTDPLWAFNSVVRTNDIVADSIAAAHLWAMDRPFSVQLIKDIQDTVQAFLDRLTALGAILGGQIWLDPELNTETELKAGKLWLDYDIEPPAPLEHLIFTARRNGAYYNDLVASVATAA